MKPAPKVGSSAWLDAFVPDAQPVTTTTVYGGNTPPTAARTKPPSPNPTFPRANTRHPLPCVHRGEPLTPAAAVEKGVGAVRTYYPCGKGYALNPRGVGGVVCGCKGCGPACADYAPEGKGDEGDG